MVEKWFEKWFSLRLNPEKINRILSRLGEDRVNLTPVIESSTLRVACVQRQIRLVSSVRDYIIMLDDFVKLAVKEKSQLVIFPEYNFFDLFGLIPGFKLIDRYLSGKAISRDSVNNQVNENSRSNSSGKNIKSNPDSSREAEDGHVSSYQFLNRIFGAVAVPVEAAIKQIMSALAARYGIYIYSGSYITKRNSELYNSGSLFEPGGKPVLFQDKINLTDFEINLGLKCSDSLQVIQLFGTKAAFPICMDATYFETFHAARAAGADIVVLPIANMEEYSLWKSLRGIWPRVQEAYVYGLKSSLNGWIAGMHFTGKAGIFAPIPLTPDGKGVLAISSHYEGDELVSACLDFEALKKARENSEYYGDINPEFEKIFTATAYK